jgi:hypothetical protein
VPKAKKPGYSKKDLREVADNPELTAEDFAKARPFSEVFPDLHRSENTAETLMSLLVRVSDQMGVIADELRKKPGVKSTSKGCDVRKYRDAFRFEDKPYYDFEAWVEAEMEDGSLLSWLVDINCTPAGWEIRRAITRSPEDDVTRMFPDVSSATFPEFVGRTSDALDDVVEAARTFGG